MTAEEFEVLEENEAELIIRWRLDELLQAGYQWDDALLLATHVDIDLRNATTLVTRGCPTETALRILL